MKETGQEPFVFEDWKEKYRVVLCLKDSEDKQTWLLEERNGRERFVLKKASGEQGKFLQAEYELLKELALQDKSINPKVIEFKSTKEGSYLLRQYVQGVTLRELVEQEGIMNVMEAAELLNQLCRRIAIFHHCNPPLIHRDIKPENIIVTAAGRVRLIDFEAARCYKPEQPEDTVCIGTRGYAAPEQFGFRQTDMRTDIYGAGKVLLYMVTAGCGEEDIKLLKTGREKQLKKIILRCCAYDPDKRYQNIEQLEGALSRFLKFSGNAFWRGSLPWILAGVMSLSLIFMGFRIYRLEQRVSGEEQYVAEEEQVSGAEEIVSGKPEQDKAEQDKTGEVNGWNIWKPYIYEEDVNEIVQKCAEGDDKGVAQACETLVEKLSQNATVMQVETVAIEELTEEEMDVYNTGRMGYEYVADRMAYKDGLIVRQLGNYEQKSGWITREIRGCIERFYIDPDGFEAQSELYKYAVEGDRDNIDGCIINILGCLNYVLDE